MAAMERKETVAQHILMVVVLYRYLARNQQNKTKQNNSVPTRAFWLTCFRGARKQVAKRLALDGRMICVMD